MSVVALRDAGGVVNDRRMTLDELTDGELWEELIRRGSAIRCGYCYPAMPSSEEAMLQCREIGVLPVVLAYPLAGSVGTWDMVEAARAVGVRVFVRNNVDPCGSIAT